MLANRFNPQIENRIMLTYTPKNRQAFEAKREYPWLLMLLVFAWLWPGVFSHDLWNPQEPQLYAVIQESRHLMLPTLLGEPHFQAAPVYVWLAGAMQDILSPRITDAYSASRFATVLFMTLGLVAHGMAGYRFLGKSFGRSVVLILIGSAGLLTLGHFLGTMSVAFAAMGLAAWAWSVAHRQVVLASFLFGLAILFLGQSMGWLISGCLLVLACVLCLFSVWRNVHYLVMLLGALAWALPLFAWQMIVLMKLNPAAWQQYWQFHIFGAFGGVANIQAAWQGAYYAKNALWFAFPAYPLAIWGLYKLRGRLLQSRWAVWSVAWLVVFGAVLLANPQAYRDNLVIILTPLAILGAAHLDDLRRGVAAFLNWFGIMAFGALSLFLWLGFVAMNYGFPAKLAERAAYFSPFYTRDIDIMPMIVASLFTPAWLFAITRKRIRGRQAISNWASGMTLAWALLLTLFLPWLDAAKSYRPIVQQMEMALQQKSPSPVSCIHIAPEHLTAHLAWREYSSLKIETQPEKCHYQLIQLKQISKIDALPENQIVWHGRRPRQKHELFVLLKK